ncbi:methyltransferase domain-containing protein [Actinophytocola gossypii]|uniref:Methyltransferase domain-containing protein n=1 Tax=Actinophytocola gossypii TaxID=2812003 RepID=A0ABT2J3T7_9PSEU|nr:methyltransferase domain-containing protein [Actinophytocola gossypii]MCT2582515.1 methyltransferase domain-containing protein [Actinophytocola gossypii]
MVADEIRERALGQVNQVGHREVWFDTATPGPAVLDLRTADDVLLIAAVVDGIGTTRADLRHLTRAARTLPLRGLLALRSRCGGPAEFDGVDVSASFLGRRAYTRYDIEDAVGEALSQVIGTPYRSRRGGQAPPPDSLPWRVTIAGERAVVSLRVGARPLHRRSYRTASRPGSLHPPLANALVRLAAPAPGARLLDPCCGTGTIPIEAALDRGLKCVGADHAPAAITAARTNDVTAHVTWLLADAARLPIDTESIDAVVGNPPWHRQVTPSGQLARDPARFWTELTRVLRPGGRAVLLQPDKDLIAPAGLLPVSCWPISLNGRHPVIVLARRP